MLKPLSNRILIKPIVVERFTESGLFLPGATTSFCMPHEGRVSDSGQRQKQQVCVGEVVAVGPGKKGAKGTRPVDAKPGDIVTFSDTCGRPVTHEGEDYLFIREDDIAAFLDKPASVEVVYRS